MITAEGLLGRVAIWRYHYGLANLELTSCQRHKILTFIRSLSDLYVIREAHCCCFAADVLWIARSSAPWRFRPAHTATRTPSISAMPAGATGASVDPGATQTRRNRL